MTLLSENELRERIERLAAIERPSASPGEAEAARLIADELSSYGARVSLEEARAHGTYWWPIGILTGLAALAGTSRSRALGAIVGAGAAVAAVDDVTGGTQWFRRTFLPKRTTTNVVAEAGDPDGDRTVVFVAHHDAAHAGLVFHPRIPRVFGDAFPQVVEKTDTTPPTMWGVAGGPGLVAAGSLLGSRRLRRLGTLLSAGYAAAMADIGMRKVVPGANDNLTGVAVLLSLARSLAEQPIEGLRVLLVSTGSEESFMEGMQAFGRAHFPDLPIEATDFICLDTVGSPHLLLLEGEGMIWMNEYPKELLALIRRAAEDEDIFVWKNLRFRNATDGLIALKAGYRTAMLGSVDRYKAPTDYHWPTDTPENVRYDTVADCARLCRAVCERLAAGEAPRLDAEPQAESTG